VSVINRKIRASSFIISVALLSGCSATAPTQNTTNFEIPNLSNQPKVQLSEIQTDEIRDSDVINRSRESVTRTGEIYLMRGLADVFSRGIDDLTEKLRQRGYDASNFSYVQWPAIAEDIKYRSTKKKVSYPIVIIGHSLGGNESSKFANFLANNGVPVRLVVTFDPVETGYVVKGVKKVVNYYLPKSADNRILSSDGHKGKIKNIDVTYDPDITHTNVDKHDKFQAATLSQIKKITRKKNRATARVSDK